LVGLSTPAKDIKRRLNHPGGGQHANLPDLPAAGEFSIAFLPDTQEYSAGYPDLFRAQTRWIANNQARYNIRAVLHAGDVVDRNEPDQWANADSAIRLLDDTEVPYLLAIGNHDYDSKGDADRLATSFNAAFPTERYTRHAWWQGGFFEPGHTENTYCLLPGPGQDYLLLNLEFGPRQAVIDWAHDLLNSHARHRAILLTHSYLYIDGTWVSDGHRHNPKLYALGPTANDGADLWHKLVSRRDNIHLVLCGHHVGGHLAYRCDRSQAGTAVHQLFANWQQADNGGNGWMHLLTIAPQAARVQTFSPTLGQVQADLAGKFVMAL